MIRPDKNSSYRLLPLLLITLAVAIISGGWYKDKQNKAKTTLWKDSKNQVQKIYQRQDMLPNIVKIVEKVSHAVVNIQTTQTIQHRGGNQFFGPFSQRGPFGQQDDFWEFFKPFFNRPREFKNKGLGTGFIINGDGYIVTNNHVIENATEIKVKLAQDNKDYPARVVGADAKTDIALIKIELGARKSLPAIKFGNSGRLKIGEWVVAIGNPFGLDHTVTAGIVSAKGRKEINPSGRQGYYDFIQTDASINPGNSGGPLLNINGDVIGINTAISAVGQGIGFAIPIDMAKTILPQLKDKGKITRSWLGIQIQQVTPELAKSFNLDKPRGALISNVVKNGPAAKGGLKSGDIIINFNNHKINNHSDVPWLASTAGEGKTVRITVIRNSKEITLQIKLGKMPEDRRKASLEQKETDVDLGFSVTQLTPQLARKMGFEDEKGVVVTDIDDTSTAFEAGLRPKDIILEINGVQIVDLPQFNRSMKVVADSKFIRIRVKRDMGILFLAFGR